MGAATVAIITGGGLWYLHPSGFGAQERIRVLGALSAVLAAGVQGAMCGPALRQLTTAGGMNTQLQGRVKKVRFGNEPSPGRQSR
jgi:hypothetical protein